MHVALKVRHAVIVLARGTKGHCRVRERTVEHIHPRVTDSNDLPRPPQAYCPERLNSVEICIGQILHDSSVGSEGSSKISTRQLLCMHVSGLVRDVVSQSPLCLLGFPEQ